MIDTLTMTMPVTMSSTAIAMYQRDMARFTCSPGQRNARCAIMAAATRIHCRTACAICGSWSVVVIAAAFQVRRSLDHVPMQQGT